MSWSAVNPAMPADAVPGLGATLESASCPVVGWCIAVGQYQGTNGTTDYGAAVIDSQSGSTWSALAAPLPADASTADPEANLDAVSCPAVGGCVAVGRYLDQTGATQVLVEQLSSGTWTPSGVTLPPDALTSGPGADAQLTALSCPATGTCSAVGLYTQASGAEQAVVADDSGGTWTVSSAPLPGAADGSQLFALSCSAAVTCVAAGTVSGGGASSGLVDTETGGSWSAATLPLPSGTAAGASVANNDLSVSCPSTGPCVIAGTTFDGSFEGFLDTQDGASWDSAAAPVPGGASSSDVQLNGVSCPAAGNCVATGLAAVSSGEEGVIETLTSGSWAASVAAPPAGTPTNAQVEVHNVACPAAGSCVADGQSDVNGNTSGVFWNLVGGTWTAAAVPLPADAVTNSDPAFAPITCPAAGACVVVGEYVGTSGREGVVETDPSLPATTTKLTLTPLSSTSVSYSATVTGSTSPTGSVTFSAGLNPLCSATLVNGTATCTAGPLKAPAALASYSGDAASSPSWAAGSLPGVPVAVRPYGMASESARVNTFFPAVPQVIVTDSSGRGVAGVLVGFTTPMVGASAILWGSSYTVTNAAGIATSPDPMANGKVGSYAEYAFAYNVGKTAISMNNTRR
ncbi:MAG TPA: hypothetical protein VLZ77_11070 [Acidimicrobiales bacterium]|nr:hypothetical protein [Acidimicrobiales bacterium]